MKKPSFSSVFAKAAMPERLKSAFKEGFATQPERLLSVDMQAPSTTRQIMGVCKRCSLPGAMIKGRCSYCGHLQWSSGLGSIARLVAFGLLLTAILSIPLPPSAVSHTVPTSAAPALAKRSTESSVALASPQRNTAFNIPLLPSVPTVLSPGNAPASGAPMTPPQQIPSATEVQPKPSVLPLTCGGFPAAGQPEPDFTPYLAKVQNKIRAHWHPPAVDQPKHVVVLYRIACNGQLVRADVKTSSGLPVADQAALAAVKLAAPFPALPVTYVGRNVDVEFDFDYEMMADHRTHTPLKQ